MQNLIRAFFALATIVIISILLFYGYENKKYGNPSLDKPSHQVIRIGDEDDYYELTIPREFLPTKYPDGQSVSFEDVLYPEMKRWTGERRENVDHAKIEFRITYHTGESSRLNSQNFRLQNIKKMVDLTKPTGEYSKKLVKKYSDIKVYSNRNTKEINDYYVFTDKNGFVVIACDSYGDTYRIHASYMGKFDITIITLPSIYFYEMPEVVNSVIDLVSTFNSTHYKNHNSQSEDAIDQEIESQKSKEKTSSKTTILTQTNS